jgi:hypothetical protein
LVIRKGQCRKPFFSLLSHLAIHYLDKYGFFRTLDDDVVVASVFLSTIIKSVLASVSAQLQPVLKPVFGVVLFTPTPSTRGFTFVHTVTAC